MHECNRPVQRRWNFNVSPLRTPFDAISPVPVLRSRVAPQPIDSVTVADVELVIDGLRVPEVKSEPRSLNTTQTPYRRC